MIATFACAYSVWFACIAQAYHAGNGIAVIACIVVGCILCGLNVLAVEARDAHIEDTMRRHPAGGRGQL